MEEPKVRKHDMSGNDPLNLKGKGWDGKYVGNIWGWRFSFVSLAIIVCIGGLMAIRTWQVHSESHHVQSPAPTAPADSAILLPH
jgi:hypothetical protein